jgi:uncharacterized membrane protein
LKDRLGITNRTVRREPAGVTAQLGSSGQERDTARTIAFSDGVFAIAITVLVLEIHPPQDTHHLGHSLATLWPSYLAYAFTFLLIGQVWANHHAIFDHIRTTDWALTFFNTLLLMNVAFLPFVASVLAAAFHTGADERTAVVVYGVTFAVGSGLFNLTWHHACRAHLFGPTIDAANEKAFTRRFLLGPILYAVGAGIGAVFPIAGLVVFAAPGAMFWLPIRHGGSATKEHLSGASLQCGP